MLGVRNIHWGEVLVPVQGGKGGIEHTRHIFLVDGPGDAAWFEEVNNRLDGGVKAVHVVVRDAVAGTGCDGNIVELRGVGAGDVVY